MEPPDYEVDVQIEIPLGSNIKYEFDHIKNRMVVDRILSTPVTYFFNYGYIPNTLSGDGDSLDAIVLCNESLLPTCFIKCKMIGVLHTEDEKGIDDKVILVPVNKISQESSQFNDIKDIFPATLNKLRCFFEDYKKLEIGKFVKVNNFGDRNDAYNTFIDSVERFKTQS